MKRFLLLISAMLVMSSMMAQNDPDIYTAGYYQNSNSKNVAGVYKNGELQYSWGGNTTSTQYEAKALLVNGSDVYWAVNRTNSDGSMGYADIYKNNGEYYLNSSTQGRRINDMFRNWNSIYAFGLQTIDGVEKAVVWKNTDDSPYKTFGANTYKSEATCGTPYLNEGSFFVAGGWQYTSSSSYHGVIWYSKNNTPLYEFPEGSKIYDIAYFNKKLYSVGTASVDGTTKVRVWENDNVLYTYDESSTRLSLYIDGGVIYVSIGGGADKIYRNTTQIYSTGGFFTKAAVNAEGVYACGSYSSKATVWKNGTAIHTYDANNGRFLAMYVAEPTCTNENNRAIPFTDNFEVGETDWDCWTKIDSDASSTTDFSYWDRVGGVFASCMGNYCACHCVSASTAQTGWLISPRICLQNNGSYKLEFKSWSDSGMTKSVWVSNDADPTNLSSYTKVWELTTAETSWPTRTVSLDSYKGQPIYIAFKYESDASSSRRTWLIDDVSVTETWSYCGASSVPYTNNFTDAPSSCWYYLDNTNYGYNWEWNSGGYMQHNDSPSATGNRNGWLFSTRIQLPGGHSYVLKFDTKTKYPSYMPTYGSSVWIATDKTGTPNIDDYTMVWYETEPVNEWRTVTVDLSPFAGHVINVAFRYIGTNAHVWYMDNFQIYSNDDINDVTPETIAIYPNPAKESIHISGLDKETEVSIYNVMGVMVQKVVTNGEEVINVSDLPAGLYIARFGENTLRFTKE